MNSTALNPASLVSELIVEAVHASVGSVGMLVRDVPEPDAEHLLNKLNFLRQEEGIQLRVAYLRRGGEEAIRNLELDTAVFSHEVERAEEWRNERDLTALIVVVAHGDEPKLSSLAEFKTVTSRNLKQILVERAIGEEARHSTVQECWWTLLGNDDGVGLGQVIDYYIALSGKKRNEFLKASSREIFRLGLLPDPNLFDDPHESSIKARLQANKDLTRRLQILTPQDRQKITQSIVDEENLERRKRLQEGLDQLHRTRWGGEGMKSLSFGQAERLVKARKKKKPSTPKPPSEKASKTATRALLDEWSVEDLSATVQALGKEVDQLDETQLRPQTIRIASLDGSSETVTTARPDVTNFMKKLLDDGVYGGWVRIAESSDLEDALRRFNSEWHVIARWDRERVLEFLDEFTEVPAGEELMAKFRAYDQARTNVLPMLGVLATEPLLTAADPDTRAKLSDLVDKYEALIDSSSKEYAALVDEYGAADVNDALANLLLIDTVVVESGQKIYAVLAPTHPLYLWHYTRYSQIVSQQRDRLDDRDRELVVEAAAELPNFLTSLYVPSVVFDVGKSLSYLGRLGSLPYFGERIESSLADDGAREIRSLIEAYLALEQHAQYGFRLALVDPPNAGVYLTLLADLAQDKKLSGAHLAVYRYPGAKEGIELRLDEDQEDHVARTFRALTPDRRFTFEVRSLPEQEIGPLDTDLFHLVIVFDRSSGKVNQVKPAAHLLQPLALPQRLRYKIKKKLVELEPLPGGPFGAYHGVVDHLSAGGGPSYMSVNQDQKMRAALQELASRCAWTIVADRHVDRDLSVGAVRVSTGRDGERDVAAFSRDTATFRRPLRDVVRTYNAFISNEDLDGLLWQLSNTLDSGLLNLRPDKTGNTNYNRIKGLLGTLIAARWFRNGSNKRRLLVSLDSVEARRWLHLREGTLRADLVGFEWEDDHCVVKVIEVKAVQSSGGEYVVKDGVVEGPAVAQMLATRRLLEQVFANDQANELITTPARREILREHLYRELAKDAYSPEDRRFWADCLQKVLDGSVKTRIVCHLLDVRLGVDVSALKTGNKVAEEDGSTVPVYITQLNEQQMEELAPREPDRTGREQTEQDLAEKAEETLAPRGASGLEAPEPKTDPGVALADPGTDTSVPPTGQEDSEEFAVRDGKAATVERVRALLGTSPGTYGKTREILFDPYLPGQELPNPHVSITGETGSGKTQATKAVVKELGEQGVGALILDFKDDYSDRVYAEMEGLCVYDPNQESLPFNPLSPQVDLMYGKVNPMSHIHQLSSIVKRIYHLGDQQAYRFREAAKRAYEARSVPVKAFEPDPLQAYPPFEDIRTQLEQEKGNEALLGRLSPIFDLDLFSGAHKMDFAAVVAEDTVVRLGQLPGDEVKNSVAEFFLMALYNHLIRQKQTHRLGKLLVLDEAWRLVESPFLEPLIREGRAFGLGILIATQFPTDLPEAISGSTATKLFFSQTQQPQIREIQRTVVGKTSGPDADHLAARCRELPPLTCVLHSKQYPPYVRVRINPYFEREGGQRS